ncbi:MAG: histidine kinase [Aquificaceae bacterium]|nr:MAG: histidine kinase [Aquificaceae bacterium]
MQSRARQTAQKVALEQEGLPVSAFLLDENTWSPLQLYSIYRLILAGMLVVIGLTGHSFAQLGRFQPVLFDAVSLVYLCVALIGVFLAHFRWPSFVDQVYLHTGIDIILLLMLVYSNGGLHSGIDLLFALPVILANVLRPGQNSLFLSAVSVIALLSIQIYLQNKAVVDSSQLTHAGLLTFFVLMVSWLAGDWLKKASKTAALAKKRGQDIASLSQLNQSILDQLQMGILVVERSGVIRHMNPRAWEMLGEPASWRSQPLKSLAPELNIHLQHWFKHTCPKIVSYDIKHWQTTELSFRLSQLGSRNKGASLIYLDDITEQREKQQEVKMASLGQLTANIAHEIRNPLGAISHAAQLLSESPALDKADTRMVQIIQSNSKRMNVTIESVLNLSRKKNPKKEAVHLQTWLSEFVHDFSMQSDLKANQVSLFVDPIDAEVQFDPTHFHQVLWNLCRNAVKYACDDINNLVLAINCSLRPQTKTMMLNVIDNGAGISEKNQERLFEPFFTTSNTQGTGLGLFMARELCLTNNASLEYIRLPAGGSCFRVIFAHNK